ncbi:MULTISPECIES: hypothetical protein [unclassified Nostoc]|nr:hypothetical protein [Nostoc sp. S13]MDF5735228.1 hypothetical protein [Nostoc sp. S13]
MGSGEWELGVKSGESHFFTWNSELFYPMPNAQCQCPMPNN